MDMPPLGYAVKEGLPGLEDVEKSNVSRSRSESNLSAKTSSHHKVDITRTKEYKEIYADNLRQYGFLLAKQLGISNKSPNQLRKTYQSCRKKADERRRRKCEDTSKLNQHATEIVPENKDGSQTHLFKNHSASELCGSRQAREDLLTPASLPMRKTSCPLPPINVYDVTSRRTSTDSFVSVTSSTESLRRGLGSLTNVSDIINNQDKKRTVIRRKKRGKSPRDQNKRLSAPLLGLENDFDVKELMGEEHTRSLSMMSLTVPSKEDMVEQKPVRKLSAESQRRMQQAEDRLKWRLSRLESFEGILSKASSFMRSGKVDKDVVTKD